MFEFELATFVVEVVVSLLCGFRVRIVGWAEVKEFVAGKLFGG